MKAYSTVEKRPADAVLTYPAGSKGNGGQMLGHAIPLIAGGSLWYDYKVNEADELKGLTDHWALPFLPIP